MRLALFSPLSPLQTAVADHVEGLLPCLAEFAQIDLFIDDGYTPDNPAVVHSFAVHSYRDFPRLADQYDITIYHMGNQPTYHGYIYKTLRQHHGLVVVHDLVLHHCIAGLTLGRGNTQGYVDEMRYAYGKEGEAVASQILSGRGLDLMYKYPLVERVLDSSLAVIVHNNYARQELLKRRPELVVTVIGQHFFLPDGVVPDDDRLSVREELGLQDRFVIATYGLLSPDKRLDVALRAFARFRRDHAQAVFLLVGPVQKDYDLAGMVRNMGLEDAVEMVGWQDPPTFVRYMFAADLALHLKYPHVGGTPYTPIRLLGLGVPTIVSNIEPLAEIPEGCCAKIDADEHEEETLLATMDYLARHKDARQEMADKGRRYIQEEHHPHKIAQQYRAFIEQILSSAPGMAPTERRPLDWEQYLIEEAAAVLAEWGVESDEDALLLPIAEAIAGLGLGKQRKGGSR